MPRQFISQVKVPGNEQAYDLKAYQSAGIYYAQVDGTSTSTVFTVTIPELTATEYYDGLTLLLYNGKVTSASGFTINVNGLGAKPSYSNMTLGNPVTPTDPTRETTIFNINYAMLFIYNSTRVSGGCWICYRGYDANTNTVGYQLRTNSYSLTTLDAFRYYKILFTSADGQHWVPAASSTTNSATSKKTPNTRPINPFGEIVYCGNSTNYAANAAVSATACWQEYTLALGYSFNTTGAALTLTSRQPVYVKCTPQANGSAIIDANIPIVQTLPSTADGSIYILLGIAYSATNIELLMNHPIYYYKEGAIRLWTNAESGLPGVSASDNGKLLTVVNGKWASATKPSYTANEVGALPSNTTYVSSVNGQSGAVTVTEGLAPLIGTTSDVTPTQVKTALAEGRDIAITHTGSIYGVLKFGSFNSADTFGIVTSQSIIIYNGQLLSVELLGAISSGDWSLNVHLLAQSSDIPTATSDLTNDSGFLTSSDAVTSFNGQTGAVTVATPGTLNTTATTAQSTSSSEALSGSISLHKIAKTGTYSDLIGTPNLATVATSGSYTDLSGTPTLGTAASLDITNEYSATGTNPITGTGVAAALATLPTPMQFKGTVGSSGTIEWSALPTAAAGNTGYVYKVISDHSTAPICKNGDTIVSNGSSWVVIPSGDEPSGTVTNVATGSGLTGGPITGSGTISHADTSSQASSTNSGRTYIQSISLDDFGHVTSLSTATETVADTKVTQLAVPTHPEPTAYPLNVLLSYGDDAGDETNSVRKSYMTYSPTSKALTTGGTINGYTLNAASAKAVDTSISAASTSSNLPTSAAVASFVEGKGYVTSNTWRPVKYSSTTLNDASTTLEFVAGSNVGLAFSSGKLTISATDTTYGGDRGISLVSGNFGHSNTAVTAITTAGLYKVKYDEYGHITGTTAIAKADITGLGIPGSDTNTTYTLNVSGTGDNANKVGLVAGGSGSGTTWYTIPYATSAGTAASASSVAWANVSGHDAGVDADLGINTSSGDTTKFLNAKGGWAVPAGTYVHPAYEAVTAAAVKIGRDSTGHVIIGAALTAADIGADTWGKATSGGLYYPTATQTIDVQESTVLITGIGATNLLKDNSDDADASLVLIGDNNVPLASASAAGATTYNMLAALNCVRDYPELYSKLSALYTNIYLKADNNQDPVGKSPTSVSVASDGTFTLTLASTVNPVSSVTSLKFGNGIGSSHTALTLGNGIYNNGMNSLVVGMCSYNTGAYSLVAGQAVYNDGGTGAMVMGARSYNSARYSLLAGDSHKNVKLGAALFGVGHDSTNGPEGIAAVGKYSLITSTTAFVVGNGTSVSARSNAFEVLTDGSVKAKGTITVNDTAVSLNGHTHTYTLNGASTTSLSFYAPTSAGTSGYVLQSNGSGAPSWVTPPSGLPDVTSSDNNKVLTVVNGAWAASASATATMIFREWTA